MATKLLTLVNSPDRARVDSKDFKRASKFRWYALKSKTCKVVYAIRYWYEGDKHKSQLLHNFILGFKGIDHINGDGLDCRRTNLRAADKSQNAANSGPHKDNTSGHKGVYLDKRDGTWYAQIMKQGKTHNLGRFKTKESAAEVYNAAAKKLFGVFAK